MIEEFQKEITNYNPDFVGLSVLSTEYADTLDQAARAVKKVTPDAIVIAGGVHVTTKYYDVMKNPDVDYACRGEGDYLLRASNAPHRWRFIADTRACVSRW